MPANKVNNRGCCSWIFPSSKSVESSPRRSVPASSSSSLSSAAAPPAKISLTWKEKAAKFFSALFAFLTCKRGKTKEATAVREEIPEKASEKIGRFINEQLQTFRGHPSFKDKLSENVKAVVLIRVNNTICGHTFGWLKLDGWKPTHEVFVGTLTEQLGKVQYADNAELAIETILVGTDRANKPMAYAITYRFPLLGGEKTELRFSFGLPEANDAQLRKVSIRNKMCKDYFDGNKDNPALNFLFE